MTQRPHPASRATAREVDSFDEHSNGDDDSRIHRPLPRSKRETEGAVIFSTNEPSPAHIHPASRATAHGVDSFVFFFFLSLVYY
jgi:hypothetical protein